MQKSSPGTLAAFAGYILYSVYVCTTFYSPTTISSVVEIGYLPKALYLFFIILGRMVGFAIVTAVIMRKKGNPSRIALVAASAACGFIGFASMILVFQLTSVTDLGALLPWFYASGVWIGLGDSFLVVLWFAFVATMQIRRMYVFLVSSAVISAVLYYGCTFLPSPLPWVAAVLSFFVSLALFSSVVRRTKFDSVSVDARFDRSAYRRLGRPLLGVVIMAFMAGLMMNVAGQENISLGTFQWTAAVTMFGLNAALLLPALLVPRAFRVPWLYKLILPLSALGFLLLPLVWDPSGRGMVNSFVQVGFTFTNVIFYCLIAEEYRCRKSSSLKTFSAMQLVVAIANFAGLFLAFFCIGYLEPGDVALTVTALAAVYAILVVTLVLFKDKNLAGRMSEDERRHFVAPQSIQPGSASSIESARLSNREQEVLGHLRQGRAPKTIAKLLVVSENTVRFHIKNIYQKFHVHSRAELMELLDADMKLGDAACGEEPAACEKESRSATSADPRSCR